MMNIKKEKTKRILVGVIAVVLVLAMIVPLVLSEIL